MMKRHRWALLLAMVVSALTLLWLGPVGAALASEGSGAIPTTDLHGLDDAAVLKEEDSDLSSAEVADDGDGDGNGDTETSTPEGNVQPLGGGGDTDTPPEGNVEQQGGGGDTDTDTAVTPAGSTAVQGAGVSGAGAGGGGAGAAGAGGGGGGGAGGAGAGGAGAAAAPAAVPVGGQLPFTGFDVPSVLTAAGMLLALGGTSLALGNRRAKSK